MTTDSPHAYRRLGQELGVDSTVIDAAVEQMASIRFGAAPILTLGHLAHSTGASYVYLRKVVTRELDPYETFSRPRRTGKMRSISAQHPVLMSVQRWILHNILDRLPNHAASYAYQRGKSIRMCAQQHCGA